MDIAVPSSDVGEEFLQAFDAVAGVHGEASSVPLMAELIPLWDTFSEFQPTISLNSRLSQIIVATWSRV